MQTLIHVGLDVHSTSISACALRRGYNRNDVYFCETKFGSSASKVRDYVDQLSSFLKDKNPDEQFEIVCGYEAGCLGYTLKRELDALGVTCKILAPSTMPHPKGGKKVKTDRRDAREIAQCLANHTASMVYVPDTHDEDVRDFIRMRDDHLIQLKQLKQKIGACCLRWGHKYERTKWTGAHLKWLKELPLRDGQKKVLEEYLATYHWLEDKLKSLDQDIENLAQDKRYAENTAKLRCFHGIDTSTALALQCEIGDFKRFDDPAKFASYLGLTPGENSSGMKQHHTAITRAGNGHCRRLLIEAAHTYGRAQLKKSARVKKRQDGQTDEVIAYADKGAERLKRRFRRMLYNHKPWNVCSAATARELACFIWGMMTGNLK